MSEIDPLLTLTSGGYAELCSPKSLRRRSNES
jgi:hypothetical protein